LTAPSPNWVKVVGHSLTTSMILSPHVTISQLQNFPTPCLTAVAPVSLPGTWKLRAAVGLTLKLITPEPSVMVLSLICLVQVSFLQLLSSGMSLLLVKEMLSLTFTFKATTCPKLTTVSSSPLMLCAPSNPEQVLSSRDLIAQETFPLLHPPAALCMTSTLCPRELALDVSAQVPTTVNP